MEDQEAKQGTMSGRISNILESAGKQLSRIEKVNVTDSTSQAIEILGTKIREEMSATLQAYREEMERNFQQQKRQLMIQAVWQWVICIGIVVGVAVKTIYK